MNRSRTESITVDVALYGFGALTIAEATTLTDDDPDAANTIDDQDRVVPVANDSAEVSDGALTITLPPVSWTAVGLTAEA